MVQWLRLHAPNAVGPGLVPGQGTKSHMLQLRPRTAKTNKQTNKKPIDRIYFLKKRECV